MDALIWGNEIKISVSEINYTTQSATFQIRMDTEEKSGRAIQKCVPQRSLSVDVSPIQQFKVFCNRFLMWPIYH